MNIDWLGDKCAFDSSFFSQAATRILRATMPFSRKFSDIDVSMIGGLATSWLIMQSACGPGSQDMVREEFLSIA